MLIFCIILVWWDFLPKLNLSPGPCHQNLAWAGWALPIGTGGNLMPLLLYAIDVLSMANKFLDLAHLRTSGTELRNLDAMAGNLRLKSLEECNKDTINASFFGIHFGHKIEEQERGGVRYALKSKQYLNNEDYALLHNLHPGNAQFFDFGEMLGPTTQSIWVSAEGFFISAASGQLTCSRRSSTAPAGYYRLGMGRKRARTRARHTN